MMTPVLEPTLVLTMGSVIGLVVVAAALLQAWHGWLEFKRQELERGHPHGGTQDGSSLGTARIELADLKERIRKLEAIASGVEL